MSDPREQFFEEFRKFLCEHYTWGSSCGIRTSKIRNEYVIYLREVLSAEENSKLLTRNIPKTHGKYAKAWHQFLEFLEENPRRYKRIANSLQHIERQLDEVAATQREAARIQMETCEEVAATRSEIRESATHHGEVIGMLRSISSVVVGLKEDMRQMKKEVSGLDARLTSLEGR